MNPLIFWGANLTFDFSLFFLSSLLMLALIVALDDTHTYTSNGAAGTMVLIMIMYGLSAIPFSYVVSIIENIKFSACQRAGSGRGQGGLRVSRLAPF